jgi:hypothetical protein
VSVLVACGCIGPRGNTAEERLASAREVRDEILERFYERDPELRQEVESAASYLHGEVIGSGPRSALRFRRGPARRRR